MLSQACHHSKAVAVLLGPCRLPLHAPHCPVRRYQLGAALARAVCPVLLGVISDAGRGIHWDEHKDGWGKVKTV